MGLLDKNKNNKFKVGDKIICIDDRRWNSSLQSINLIFKNQYIIQDIIIDDCGDINIDIGCRFNDSTVQSVDHVTASDILLK